MFHIFVLIQQEMNLLWMIEMKNCLNKIILCIKTWLSRTLLLYLQGNLICFWHLRMKQARLFIIWWRKLRKRGNSIRQFSILQIYLANRLKNFLKNLFKIKNQNAFYSAWSTISMKIKNPKVGAVIFWRILITMKTLSSFKK
jgi:hypothetical protein